MAGSSLFSLFGPSASHDVVNTWFGHYVNWLQSLELFLGDCLERVMIAINLLVLERQVTTSAYVVTMKAYLSMSTINLCRFTSIRLISKAVHVKLCSSN